ncbi:MAG: hypothetical protein OXU67_14610 [Chloroflexota bacterium]|nr:hypothetical protein [Chloroflexota bacterium]
MSGRLRTAGLWLVGCVAVLVVTSLVASIGAPPPETAPAPAQPAASAPVEPQDSGAPGPPRLKSLLEHYDLERLHEAGASTLTSSGLGTMDPRGYAAAREVLRGYGDALQQHIELTGVLRPRSAALQRLDALDQVSAALQNLPPAVLATVGSEVALQLVELETIALARRVRVLGETASSDDRTVVVLTNRLERLVRRAEGALINLRRAAGTG